LILFSCNTTDNEENIIASQGKDSTVISIKKAEKIINLTRVNVDTNNNINLGMYKIGIENERIPGPSDYYLIATFNILEIDTTDLQVINTIKETLEKNNIYYKYWLPNNVIKTLFTNETFKETKIYSAELFYKSPYLQGFFIIQNDSTIYLHLQTK